MNVTKDESILTLLGRIDLQSRGWTIRDRWDADLCAVGISSELYPDRLVYVSTYGKPEGKYDYECEQSSSSTEDETDYKTVDEGHSVDFAELVDAMEKHLGKTT